MMVGRLAPFRFWCQKVLPLVYDDSLSYNELLCKVVDYLNRMGSTVNQLVDIYNNLDVTEAVSEKLDQMAQDGTLDVIIARYINMHGAWIDVSTMVPDRVLTSENIAQAMHDALEHGSLLYIPAGEYTFNAKFEYQTMTIWMDANCRISTDIQLPALDFQHCSVHLLGGQAVAGPNDNSRTNVGYPASFQHDGDRSIIRLQDCWNSSISGLYSPWSKMWAVVYVKDSQNVEIVNCRFNRSLNASIFLCQDCKQVAVRNCYFANNLYALEGNGDPRYFCYFVYTGSTAVTDVYEPVDGLIYENNYCVNSEDSALDTHGARNVIIRNNTILECGCSITAYNDNRRVTRPNSWKMSNVLIENNYCKATKPYTRYNHPFILLGAANGNSITDEGYSTNPGSYDAFSNCTVRNNTFIYHVYGVATTDTPEPNEVMHVRRAIQLNAVSKNVTIQDNVIDVMHASYAIGGSHVINGVITNNTFVNKKGVDLAYNASIVMDSGYLDTENNYLREIVKPKGMAPYLRNGNVFGGGSVSGASTEYALVQGYGKRASEAFTGTDTFTVTVANHVAYFPKHNLLPFLSVTLTAQDQTVYNAWVGELIDFDNFEVYLPTDLPNGTYTLKIRRCFTYEQSHMLVPATVTTQGGTSVRVRVAADASAEEVGSLPAGAVCLTMARNASFYSDSFRYVVGISSGALIAGYAWAESITPVDPAFA